MHKISDKEMCLRKVHTHLLADPPRISAAMITIQKYGEQLGVKTEILEFTQDTPLSDERLALSARQLNALDFNGMTFLGQLLSAKLSMLESIPYLERSKIFAKLEQNGLAMGMELPKTAKHCLGEFKLPCWSNAPQSEPGWYWVRTGDGDCHISYLSVSDMRNVLAIEHTMLSGPIPKPQN